jgi:hypothetical protein
LPRLNPVLASERHPLRWPYLGKCLLRVVSLAIVSVFLVLAALKGVLAFEPAWDYMAYHLPFSLMHVGLTSYTPEPYLMVIFDSFPPAAHIAAGLLILFTGVATAGVLINAAALICCMAIWRKCYPGIDVLFMCVSALALPHVVVHLGSGYIDLSCRMRRETG